jgi:glyoxylase-like metal-dependent hydrolase (beta-lactamase superfamily II)
MTIVTDENGDRAMDVQYFFDKETSTLTYIVYDPKTRNAVIIDPVLNYSAESDETSTASLKFVTGFIIEHNLNPIYSLETHAHADHISSSQHLKVIYPQIKIAISKHIVKVQKAFKDILNMPQGFTPDGSQFDKLIDDNEKFSAGSINIHAIPTPGHTPACISFHINNMVFCGDALFLEDSGTGRCDFPNGSAGDLYHSIHENLYSLPDNTIVFVGHDYQPNGRELRFETTIGSSKKNNCHLTCETTKEEYVNFRETRDKTLQTPKLLVPSIRANINAGVYKNRI